jgi:hypothetical protein
MAIRFAVANGNWSNTATWNGGTLPASNDDVFTNNFNVTIDIDITAITLRNLSNASPAIAAGGQFILSGSSGTRVITLTDVTSGVRSGGAAITTTAIRINSTSGATVTINSDFNNAGSQPAIFCNGNCIVNLVGSSTGVFGSFFSNNTNANGGTLNIVGNIAGNVFAGGGSLILGSTNYTTNITGNVTGSGGWCITTNSTTVNITGNLFGGTEPAINAGTSCVINITGNVTAGTAMAIGGGGAVAATGVITVTVNGTITSSSTAVAISATNVLSLVTANGNLVNVNSVNAFYCPRMRISPTTSQSWTFQTSGSNRQLLTTNAFTDFPSVNDVRFGVTYSNLGSLTGLARIPNPDSVAFGVPVGPTATGTAMITRTQFLTDMGAIASAYNI